MTHVRFQTAGEALNDVPLMEAWTRWVAECSTPYAMYATPRWLRAYAMHSSGRYVVASCLDARGCPSALLVVELGSVRLPFQLRRTEFGAVQVPLATILGSDVMGSGSAGQCDILFRELRSHVAPDFAIGAKCVTRGSTLDRYIESGGPSRLGLVDRRDSHDECLWLADIARDTDEYLARFTAKHRYNLKRELRICRAAFSGGLELRCYSEPRDVAHLTEQVRCVTARSWKMTSTSAVQHLDGRAITDAGRAAAQGLLRSYVLAGDNQPIAYALGFQDAHVFHYSDVAYDHTHAALSPGKVLLYLLIDDLHRCRRPGVINFGIGESGYKQHFGNRSIPYRSMLWAPGALATRARIELHHAFDGVRRSAKRWLTQ
jgi:hypothetical protein